MGKVVKNAIKLSSRTVLFLHPCAASSKMRLYHGLKKHFTKDFIKHLNEDHLNNYDHTCGYTKFSNNGAGAVELPNESWSPEKCMLEFRHNLTC